MLFLFSLCFPYFYGHIMTFSLCFKILIMFVIVRKVAYHLDFRRPHNENNENNENFIPFMGGQKC